MWQAGQWVAWVLGAVVLAMASAAAVGFAEQPLIGLPEALKEAIRGPEGLAGVSWSVIEDTDASLESQGPMIIGQHLSAEQQDGPSLEWLDLHAGKSRAANREPDILRQEF